MQLSVFKFYSSLTLRSNMHLKWGIAAAGRITHDFVTALGTIEGGFHTVVAIADVDLHRAEEFAQRHSIPKAYAGFEALAVDDSVQIVYVGTLNPHHYDVTRLMLDHGKHVLCEKPLCLNYAQALELYELAKERQRFLMEGMWSRCFPSYRRLRELLLSDTIGAVQRVQVVHGFQASNVERIWTRSLGGSITLDIGLYALQLGQLIFGCAPQRVEARALLNGDGVDVECRLLLDYGQNRTLSALVSGLKNLNNQAKLQGSKGDIVMPNYWCCTSLTTTTMAQAEQNTETWPLPDGAAKHHFNHTNSCGLRYEAEQVRLCLQGHLLECPLYTHAQSLELISIEDEIRRQIGVSYAL